jgi:sulfate permease, SulP family
MVPEAMAYAGIAGVPVQYGLYAIPLALPGYPIFGSSRELVVGPSASVVALSAASTPG